MAGSTPGSGKRVRSTRESPVEAVNGLGRSVAVRRHQATAPTHPIPARSDQPKGLAEDAPSPHTYWAPDNPRRLNSPIWYVSVGIVRAP